MFKYLATIRVIHNCFQKMNQTTSMLYRCYSNESEFDDSELFSNNIIHFIESCKIIDDDVNSSKKSYSEIFAENNILFFLEFISNLSNYINRLNYYYNTNMKCVNPYDGLIEAYISFNHKYPKYSDIEILSLAVMKLLLKYVYNQNIDGGKFTVGYTMSGINIDRISYILDKSIDLRNTNGEMKPSYGLYMKLIQLMLINAEKYQSSNIYDIRIRVYYQSKNKEQSHINISGLEEKEVNDLLFNIFQSEDFLSIKSSPPIVQSFKKKREIPKYITKVLNKTVKMKAFIVADIETIMYENDKGIHYHVPYAAGFLLIQPDVDVGSIPIHKFESYYSEDLYHDTFLERSDTMMVRFIERISNVSKNQNIKSIYFHNMSKFDGIILMKYYIIFYQDKYNIKALMRNNCLYQLSIYNKGNNLLLYKYMDSLKVLPGTLNNLGKAICPELGSKGSVNHESVKEDNLKFRKSELIDYMIQDIRLLGGIMCKIQANYFRQFDIGITEVLTISSLALLIYRMKYYDMDVFPIYIPSRNEDNFIRRGYYGGHSDVYIKKGENLNYYDVNSLYPYVMKEYPMPGGQPTWHSDFNGKDLNELFGFIEAYVECPTHIHKPFLPYKEHDILRFPTGIWVGVYFSEELKLAKSLGYTIIPIKGYLYEKNDKMVSPFKIFVESLFEKRIEAKKNGDEAMSYVYKTIMNSLYGRFGINPKSLITEICDKKRYDSLVKNIDIEYGMHLEDSYYLVRYYINTELSDDSKWNPPRNSAVQLSAAITAYARIYMYKYISRSDCYYTDTDSVVLQDSLPDEMISSSELGKFKLEHYEIEGIFLAPKSYILKKKGDPNYPIKKHKGVGKDYIDEKWYDDHSSNDNLIDFVDVSTNFKIDHFNFVIMKNKNQYRLNPNIRNKRMPILFLTEEGNQNWLYTKPIHIDKSNELYVRDQKNELEKLELEKENNKLTLKVEKMDELEKEIQFLNLNVEKLTNELLQNQDNINDTSKEE
ncbi:hypothetical protein BrnaMpl_p1 (mitochondrion) [Brassica napus]|uniref:DNA polymerase n=1 Tax=Brassica napus TaxID=3708 RepID=Q8HD79_BRANA|nr:hypothetical protein BrnaMpl_p1 [Brassica napus]BAC16364.1 orf5 [Brassica napus]